jgi:ubiquinone/menaquinone biosynthesis C-methylase UbiE
MNKEEDKYNRWHFKQKYSNDIDTVWHKSVISNLDSEKDLEDKVILEIACGRGGFTNWLSNQADKPAKIIACDYSEQAISIAKERYPEQNGLIEWRVEDMQNLPFADNTFDTIISCETIEHIKLPKKALSELHRVLKPGGSVYLTCPNYFNLFGLWCLYRWMIGKPYTEGGQGYVNYARLPNIVYWVKKIGFKIVKLHTSDIVLPIRVHLHFFKKCLWGPAKIFGLQTFYILRK